MALNNGKHIVSEIEGVRCTIVDDKADKNRADFLKELLSFNKFEVKVIENPKKAEEEGTTYSIGVTDMLFNPVIAIYQKTLFNKYGRVVTPNYWNQKGEDEKIPYWTIGREIIDIYRDECNAVEK